MKCTIYTPARHLNLVVNRNFVGVPGPGPAPALVPADLDPDLGRAIYMTYFWQLFGSYTFYKGYE